MRWQAILAGVAVTLCTSAVADPLVIAHYEPGAMSWDDAW